MKKLMLLLPVIAGHVANAQSSWSITGNSNTSPSTNFVGTITKESLVFRVNNLEQMRINQIGRVTFQGLNSSGSVWDKNLFFGGGVNQPTGYNNTVFGLGSLTLNIAGQNNSAFGLNVLSSATEGTSNTGVGTYALRLMTSGTSNTGIGVNALAGPGTMDGNTAVGESALLRDGAMATDYVAFNTAMGYASLGVLYTGNNNCAYGSSAFKTLENGNNNIAIGESAGIELQAGENNIFIGASTHPFSHVAKNELNIGNWIFGVNGTIGIGTFNSPLPSDGIAQDGEKYKLFVKDGIRTEKIKVDIATDNGWADYVFDKGYQLRSLAEVENFINKNGHLPEVPNTEEAIKNGVELKAMNILLLKKIEELTLYSIEQQKRIEAVEKQMSSKL